jgi:hypothetical protein
MADLEPKVIVNQIVQRTTPITPTDLRFIGIAGQNRLQVYRGQAGSYIGGAAKTLVFPDITPYTGAVVEDTSAVLDVPEFPNVLRPQVYITTQYGVAEIDSSYITYNLSADPPTFSISAAATANFRLVSGTVGSLASLQFTDTTKGFDVFYVETGAIIWIKNADGVYCPSLVVTNVYPDAAASTLVVTKYDKGLLSTATAFLSAQGTSGLRTLTQIGANFISQLTNPGDLVIIDNWERKVNELGGDYTAADTSGVRTFTDLNESMTVALNDVVWYYRAAHSILHLWCQQ